MDLPESDLTDPLENDPQWEPELMITDLTEYQQLPAEASGSNDDTEEEPPEPPKEPKAGPPSLKEWQDFLGLTVLRILAECYLNLTLFREIEEADLTPREREMIMLTKQDLKDMAAPLASVANKNKLARKHGRTVIAVADSYEAMIDLFIWARRVNKITKKYRKVNHPNGVVKGKVSKNGVVPQQDGEQVPASDPGSAVGPYIGPGTGG